MELNFEWDMKKASKNLRKHGISFEEGATVFGDPLSITVHDPLHSEEEDRFVLIGQSIKLHTLVVVHSERNGKIRIISARVANQLERKTYEENN